MVGLYYILLHESTYCKPTPLFCADVRALAHELIIRTLRSPCVFTYPVCIYIPCWIYKSPAEFIYLSVHFIYPPVYLHIPMRIYISPAGFIYPHVHLYIPCWIYKSPAEFIYLSVHLYIPMCIYISCAGFIYPARDMLYPLLDLYIPLYILKYNNFSSFETNGAPYTHQLWCK